MQKIYFFLQNHNFFNYYLYMCNFQLRRFILSKKSIFNYFGENYTTCLVVYIRFSVNFRNSF